MFKTKILIAASAAFFATTVVQANDFVSGGQPKMKVNKAQLAIKNPEVEGCPIPVKMTGWIFTNKPGTVQYMIARKGGNVVGPYEAEAVKGANGIHIASFTQEFPVFATTDVQYRILIGKKYGKTLSNWAPLNVNC